MVLKCLVTWKLMILLGEGQFVFFSFSYLKDYKQRDQFGQTWQYILKMFGDNFKTFTFLEFENFTWCEPLRFFLNHLSKTKKRGMSYGQTWEQITKVFGDISHVITNYFFQVIANYFFQVVTNSFFQVIFLSTFLIQNLFPNRSQNGISSQ